ncbi:hypothetical protein BKA80DRAFT_276056 [Phyllosticta citrichinensis]
MVRQHFPSLITIRMSWVSLCAPVQGSVDCLLPKHAQPNNKSSSPGLLPHDIDCLQDASPVENFGSLVYTYTGKPIFTVRWKCEK